MCQSYLLDKNEQNCELRNVRCHNPKNSETLLKWLLKNYTIKTLYKSTPIECAVRASPKCSDPEPHTDRHSLVYHRLRTLAITSSLYGLKIIPKSVISLIDALFVFLRYTFFLIYIPAKITWTLYWRFLAFISEYFFGNVCDGPTFTCLHRPYITVIKARQQTCGKVPL